MILPVPGDGFEWRLFGERWGLVCVPLDAVAAHVFTGRDWPIGRPPPSEETSVDDRHRAIEGYRAWRAVANAVRVEEARLRRARQVHGAAVAMGFRDPAQPLPAADVIVVSEPGEAAAIQVADCLPLLIVDGATGVVAAVHAGWRGLSARAPQVAVDTLVGHFGARPADLLVAIGPSIGPCCYEVGSDVRLALDEAGCPVDQVTSWFHDRPARSDRNPSLLSNVRRTPMDGPRWFFDTWAAASDQLTAKGVLPSQVFRAELCTASHPDVLCSYRRDGQQAGRLAAAIRCGECRP